MCVPRRRQPRRRQNREARDAFTGFQLSAFLIRVSASFFCRGFNRQKRCFVFFVTPRRFIPPVDRVVRRLIVKKKLSALYGQSVCGMW
jgi:hypothetical protein